MKGQFKFKPGTIALFFFIAIVGYATYTLVAGDLHDIGASTEDEREFVMKCSELDISFVDVERHNSSVDVFFRSNRDLPGVSIGFEGSNASRVVEDITADKLHNATVNVSSYSNIYIETGNCPDPYWLR